MLGPAPPAQVKHIALQLTQEPELSRNFPELQLVHDVVPAALQVAQLGSQAVQPAVLKKPSLHAVQVPAVAGQVLQFVSVQAVQAVGSRPNPSKQVVQALVVGLQALQPGIVQPLQVLVVASRVKPEMQLVQVVAEELQLAQGLVQGRQLLTLAMK